MIEEAQAGGLNPDYDKAWAEFHDRLQALIPDICKKLLPSERRAIYEVSRALHEISQKPAAPPGADERTPLTRVAEMVQSELVDKPCPIHGEKWCDCPVEKRTAWRAFVATGKNGILIDMNPGLEREAFCFAWDASRLDKPPPDARREAAIDMAMKRTGTCFADDTLNTMVRDYVRQVFDAYDDAAKEKA